MKNTSIHNKWLTRSDNGWKYGEARGPSDNEASREEVLAAFLGEERCAAVFADLRPEPMTMRELVDAWVKEQKPEELRLQDKLIEQWPDVIGPDNAAQCKLLKIDNGTATLEVQKSIFMFTMNLMKGEFEKKLSKATEGVVTRVRFTLAGASWSRFSKKG